MRASRVFGSKNGHIPILVFLLSFVLGFQTVWAQSETKLLPDTVKAGSYFGSAVAIDGIYAVVGAYLEDRGGLTDVGAAYIYRRNGSEILFDKKLMATDGASTDWFGYSVAINGNFIAIGVPYDDDNGSNSGSVYIFERQSGVWVEQSKIVPASGAAKDYFGWSVSIYQNYLAVGASGDDSQIGGLDVGSVYIFEWDGETWNEVTKIIPEDASTMDSFGYSVSIGNGTLLVGAPLNEGKAKDSGAAYVYTRTDTGWALTKKLLPDDGAENDYFGRSVGLSDTVAIVGAYTADTDFGVDAGAAYIFEYRDSDWQQVIKLQPTEAEAGDLYGASVSVRGEYAAVGAPYNRAGGIRSGAAFVYQRGETGWLHKAKLAPSDGNIDDLFGSSVCISSEFPLVGSPQHDIGEDENAGAAYLYYADNPLPVELSSFAASRIGRQVQLVWTTQTETNNYGFEIQRKQKEWQTIGFLPGAGTTDEAQTYRFLDEPNWGAAPDVIFYRLKQVDTDGSYHFSEIVRVSAIGPDAYRLSQNFPNPFNPVTTISYTLPKEENVRLAIFDINGKRVATLVDGKKPAGEHRVRWNGTDDSGHRLASGVYFYRIRIGDFTRTRKLILAK